MFRRGENPYLEEGIDISGKCRRLTTAELSRVLHGCQPQDRNNVKWLLSQVRIDRGRKYVYDWLEGELSRYRLANESGYSLWEGAMLITGDKWQQPPKPVTQTDLFA